MTITSKWGYKSLEGKSSTIAYLTGLPNEEVFKWVAELYEPAKHLCQKLGAHDQILLALMRLRLDLHLCLLAQMFDVGKTTASEIFQHVIGVLARELSGLIVWPDDTAFYAFLPRLFKKRQFKNVRVIVDCTEVRIERASSTTMQSATWSSYKHANTMKFLIGITPNGLISYVSECWGGKVSDKQPVLQTDFTQHLQYGDAVMADRGFNVAEELGALGVQLVVPAYTKGKTQLSRTEVYTSREISRRRIRVEQVIGRMKRYRILRNVVPYHMKDYLDDIIRVIAALTNLLPKFA
ncbi:uncharacterized protein LOC135398538 [Ornithodoros turicata]|uniref:uncharacterized protein LOC135398538 n=1 Tax=Ornithodoros turicata TaxID=34597 RepID=UPI0031398A60